MAEALDSTVLVTGIPYITDDVEDLKNKLEKYFGQDKHGGGDVESVICRVGGNLSNAIVAFESAQVADTVIQHGDHLFEEEEIEVQKLPPVYSLITVELEQYYWDIIPRDKAADHIKDLTQELDAANVFCQKHTVQKLNGTYQQLEKIADEILELAGIVTSKGASAFNERRQFLNKCVEITNIPFITEDPAKLKRSLKDAVGQDRKLKVEDIITPIKGNMAKAIVAFESSEDRDCYMKGGHVFDGEQLKMDIPPKVFQKSSVKLNMFYKNMVPKRTSVELQKQLSDTFGPDVSLNGTEITAPFESLNVVIDAWMKAAGLPQGKHPPVTPTAVGGEEQTGVSPIDVEEHTNGAQRISSDEQEDSWVQLNAEDVEEKSMQDENGHLGKELEVQESNPLSDANQEVVADEMKGFLQLGADGGDTDDVEVDDQTVTTKLVLQIEDVPKADATGNDVDKELLQNAMEEQTEVSGDSNIEATRISRDEMMRNEKDEKKSEKKKNTEIDEFKEGSDQMNTADQPETVPQTTIANDVDDSNYSVEEDRPSSHEESPCPEAVDRNGDLSKEAASESSNDTGISEATSKGTLRLDCSSQEESEGKRDDENRSGMANNAASSSRVGSKDKMKNVTLAITFSEADDTQQPTPERVMTKSEAESQERDIQRNDNSDSKSGSVGGEHQEEHGDTNTTNRQGDAVRSNVDLAIDESESAEDKAKIHNSLTEEAEPKGEQDSSICGSEPEEKPADDKLDLEEETVGMGHSVDQPQVNQSNATSETGKNPHGSEVTEKNAVEVSIESQVPASDVMEEDHGGNTYRENQSSALEKQLQNAPISAISKTSLKAVSTKASETDIDTSKSENEGSKQITREAANANPLLSQDLNQTGDKTTKDISVPEQHSQISVTSDSGNKQKTQTTSSNNDANEVTLENEDEHPAEPAYKDTGKETVTDQSKAIYDKDGSVSLQDSNKRISTVEKERTAQDIEINNSVEDAKSTETTKALDTRMATKQDGLQGEQVKSQASLIPGHTKALDIQEIKILPDKAKVEFKSGGQTAKTGAKQPVPFGGAKSESGAGTFGNKSPYDHASSRNVNNNEERLQHDFETNKSSLPKGTTQTSSGFGLPRQAISHKETPLNDLTDRATGSTDDLVKRNSKGGTGASDIAVTNVQRDVQEVYDYVSIDAITYKYVSQTCKESLKKIKSKFNVVIEIEVPDPRKPADQIAVFKPQKKATKEDQTNAKEEFIKLYQEQFFKVKRVSLKCEGLPENKAKKAEDAVKRTQKKVVLQKDTQGFIFGGEEKDVEEAVAIFRREAGIQPKPRKLKRKSSNSTVFESDRDEYVYAARQEKRGRKTGDTPSDFPSVFCSNEGLQVIVLQDNITTQHVDIIVNAANGKLNHNGGVAGAISRAAGDQLQRDCNSIMYGKQPLQTGQCIETKGYMLPCQYVIHAVGPVFQEHQSYDGGNLFFERLMTTFTNILLLAETKKAKTIAIPLISLGNFGGPKSVCANALAMALYNFSSSPQRRHLKQIFLVNIDQEATTILQSNFAAVFPTDMEDADETEIESEQNQRKPTKYKTDEGIEVVVTQGDITKGSVEVIVNAANGQLLHGGGVAGAIARAAGRRIQEECNKIISQRGRSLGVGECEVTDGYNLKCKVIHAVGPEYNKCHSDKEFFDKLKQTFIAAIKHANLPVEAQQVALPLVSSGIFGGPNQLCAQALAQAVREFSRNEGYLILKRIFLVNIDKETTDEVRRACETCFSGATSSGVSAASIDRSNANPTKRSDDDDGGFSVQSNRGITISVLLGDITKQHADVIVCPTSPTLRHDGGVGGAIADAAGYQMQKHCNFIYNETRKTKVLSVGETVATSGYDLRCDQIIHTLGPTFQEEDPNRFCQVLEHTHTSCLQLANTTMKKATIAVPLIGASSGPSETCAKAFADAIHWLDKEANINLKNITMVTKDEACFTAVQNVLAAYFQSETASTTDVDTTEHVSTDRFPEYVFKTTEDMEIRVRTDDVAKQATDIIFNYTDEKMTNEGKLSQRLCVAAGPKLQEECKKRIKERKVLSKGSFLSTEGFQLPCKHIMHAAIPHQHSQSEEDSEMNWLIRMYMSSFFTAKTTLRVKSITVPLIYSTDATQNMTNAYCNALATAILGFSKQMQQTSRMITIYVVNLEPTATAVVEKVFSDTFKCVDVVERQKSPPSSATMNKGAKATAPVITKQPTRGRGSNNPLQGAAFGTQHTNTGKVKHGQMKGHASTNTQSSRSTLLAKAYKCEFCHEQKEKLHTLEGCKHRACLDCIRDFVTPNSLCQTCGALYGLLTEPTLGGRMKYYQSDLWKLEGKPAIAMSFDIPTGVQSGHHPKPGRQFKGFSAVAYLPDTKEGREVLSLLTWAFLNGLMFEISTSGSGEHDRVILGDIPLKYKTHGGYDKGAYPDSKYLPTVKRLVERKQAAAQGSEV